jgi:squalene synthase HpnC
VDRRGRKPDNKHRVSDGAIGARERGGSVGHWDFQRELAVWGPDAPLVAVPREEAERYCRRLATGHYENFPVVSALLPADLRQHFFNVYAYCRWSDDLGDEVGDPARSLELLAWWRELLKECYASRPRHPVFVALLPTIRRFDIPPEPLEDLLSAFEQDQTVREYDTFENLLDYCRRSANPVGRLVLMLMGKGDGGHFAWSDSICTGLQLANFWQDVSRDLDIGRVYLPREDMVRFGVSQEDLALRRTTPAYRELLRFQVERTRPYLAPWRTQGRSEMRQFSTRQQMEVELFARGGLEVLRKIEAIGYDTLRTRPVVTKADGARLLAGCVWRGLKRRFVRG